MGVGPLDPQPKPLACQHVGGGIAAAYHCRPGAINARVRALGTTQAKLQHRIPLGRVNHPAGLGGDKGLVVHQGKQRRFHQLGLHNGRPYPQQGLIREYQGPFLHAVDLPGKAQLLQHV